MQHISSAIDAVMAKTTEAVELGLRIAKAQNVLMDAAGALVAEKRLARMLMTVADALPARDDRVDLCRNNAEALNTLCRGDGDDLARFEMSAVDVAAAADAFTVAADALAVR